MLMSAWLSLVCDLRSQTPFASSSRQTVRCVYMPGHLLNGTCSHGRLFLPERILTHQECSDRLQTGIPQKCDNLFTQDILPIQHQNMLSKSPAGPGQRGWYLCCPARHHVQQQLKVNCHAKVGFCLKIFRSESRLEPNRMPSIQPSTGGGQQDSLRVITAWFAQVIFSAHESIRSLHNRFRTPLPAQLR